MVFSVESGKREASRSGRSEPPKKEIGPQGVEPLAVSRCVPLYAARFVPNRKTGEGRRKNRRRTPEGRPDRPTRAACGPKLPEGPRGTARQRAPKIALIMPAFGRSRTISVRNEAPVLCMLGARAVRAGTSLGRLACTRLPFRAGHGLGHRPGDFADGGERKWEERLCERAKAVRRVLRRRIDAPFWEVDVRERSQRPLNSASASGRNAS